ncbi:hypothetical protein RAS12_10250 [Achromobacter seleniivolatilans]|uniref:Uncharacterized protein n=1 Tax=Achromobacter seleniivolatilans TaxID=3047478 RepID=A0ABY9M818_9BURK|nr:hypothetical protein [Achromobacter sp. R39]WMD22729.1 hypothetical protein RAS12_10250 [Achromobacter sp. R39]
MSWLTVSIIAIVIAGAAAAVIRLPGVILYDWLATRKRNALAAQQALPAKHQEPATLAG